MQMKDDTKRTREHETGDVDGKAIEPHQEDNGYELEKGEVYFIWPKPENRSHPEGPADRRSNTQPSKNIAPIVLTPAPYKIPCAIFQIKRINILL